MIVYSEKNENIADATDKLDLLGSDPQLMIMVVDGASKEQLDSLLVNLAKADSQRPFQIYVDGLEEYEAPQDHQEAL